jgi:FG-GAP-like repeat
MQRLGLILSLIPLAAWGCGGRTQLGVPGSGGAGGSTVAASSTAASSTVASTAASSSAASTAASSTAASSTVASSASSSSGCTTVALGTFAAAVDYPVGGLSFTVAVADMNGDGKPDIVTSGVSVLLNTGDGTFGTSVDYVVPGLGAFTSVALGDMNGDGAIDVVVNESTADTLSVLLNEGDGTLASGVLYSAGAFPFLVALADLNGDGALDVAVCDDDAAAVVNVLLNTGDGTLGPLASYPAGSEAQSVAVGDLNGDGAPDLVVTGDSGTLSVLLNSGDGTFTSETQPLDAQPQSVAVGDLNGDGAPDLAITTYDPGGIGLGSVQVLLNQGDATFAPPVAYPVGVEPYSVAMGDFDGDGKLDLAIANTGASPGPSTVSVLINNGDGTFGPTAAYATGAFSSSVAVGDFNGDGALDIVVLNGNDHTVSVLINNGCAP